MAKADKPRAKNAEDAWHDGVAVRVRMYRHGLGDCFLLTFPKPRGRDFTVLIDCGVILGTPHEVDVIRKVVENLKLTLDHDGTPTLDVLVATHEHWDHLSAFASIQKEFADFEIGQVWMAWTEDPKSDLASELRAVREEKLKALRMGIAHVRNELAASGSLAADGHDGAAAADFRRIAEVLSFYGIDPESPLPGDEALGAAGKARKLGIADAMNWCRDRPKDQRKFWKPGDVIEPKEVKGLRVHVLGPPTDRRQLHKSLPTKKGREAYEDESGHHLEAPARAFFGADVGQPRPERSRAEFDRSTPFDPKYRIGMDEAAALDFYRAHYFGAGTDDGDAWRRIDGEALVDAAAFALQLDSDTNNTSLALAFELSDGRVLLFPGDAQIGNWESWHVDGDGKDRAWEVDGTPVKAADLLKRTVLYKVGHHGSHNATLRGRGLELMTDPHLTALVPVDTYIAHEKKNWGKMPFDPLMDALRVHAKGRVIVADLPIAEMPPGTFPRGRAVDATDATITVAGPDDKDVTRPLYVDYFVPST